MVFGFNFWLIMLGGFGMFMALGLVLVGLGGMGIIAVGMVPLVWFCGALVLKVWFWFSILLSSGSLLSFLLVWFGIPHRS